MAAAPSAYSQPPSESFSRQSPPNPQTSFSSAAGSYHQEAVRNPYGMSFSQAPQGLQVMKSGGPFRQYGNDELHRREAPQIYSAVYSGVDVYEMEVNNIAVMRRRKDSWLNATQILKVAGIEKGKRTKVLEKEILIGDHEKVQGGYGKYQGTWIRFERGVEFCRQYGVEELLRPLLQYDMGQDGGVAGRGGIDTPTKEQAMAAQRKRMYNTGVDGRSSGQSGTFFKNISSTASTAVAAISKARYDSPGPAGRMRNGGGPAPRPATFSRQSSQQYAGSQEAAFPASQQSMQSYVSNDSFGMNGAQDSAYGPGPGAHFSHHGLPLESQEPPRKKLRSSPGPQDMRQPMNGDHYDTSMREATPTEPNESFMYQQTHNDGIPMPLGPLPVPSTPAAEEKKGLLMSLFTEDMGNDYSDHKVFRTMSGPELDMPIDNTAHTALHWAATLARIPLLKALIRAGASICRVNRAGETALMRACVVTNNHDMTTFPDILELLGPTIELVDARGRTVLHHIAVTSAVKGRSQASKYYLESLLEFVVRQGSAPNSQASFNSRSHILRSMGIATFMSQIVNLRDNSGDTALNIAARIRNRNIISQLMEVNADAGIPNHSNLCPMDFGVGDPANAGGSGGVGSPNKQMSRIRETSGEIITSITSLLSQTEDEFNREMESKQGAIDAIHVELRNASAALGEERRRLEALQDRKRRREEQTLRLSNLSRAAEDEKVKLEQLRRQFGQVNTGTSDMRLGDADRDLVMPEIPDHVLASITSNSQQPPFIDEATRQILATLPSNDVLRARLAAYKSNNEELSEAVRVYQSKNTERIAKYRKLISLCTGTDINKIDALLDNLMRAVESEQNDVELPRVREFLSRVDSV